jgi:hypothetical protein
VQGGAGNTIATDVAAFCSWRASETTQMLMCNQKLKLRNLLIRRRQF